MEPICKDDLRKLIYKSSNMTDYDVAVVVHAMLKDRFAYLPLEKGKGIWYKSVDNCWRPTGLEDLKRLIFEEVSKEYVISAFEYSKKCTVASNDDDCSRYAEVASSLSKISLKLRQVSYVKLIIEVCRTLFKVDRVPTSH